MVTGVPAVDAGGVIYTPADEWHWHGAAPDHFITHLSITEALPGDERPEADWGEGSSLPERHQRRSGSEDDDSRNCEGEPQDGQ